MRTEPLQLAGGAYTDESRPFSIQDTLNMRAQRTEAGGTRSPDKLQTLPGLRPFVEAGTEPVRGSHNAEGRLLMVSGGWLYRITGSGVAVPIGQVPGSGRVMIDHNQISLGNEVVVVNGSAGYLWNTVTDAFGRITDPGFPGGAVVKFIDGYFVVIEPQGRFAQSSSPAQGLEWNTLDRFTSEVSPDRLMAAGVRGSELLLLSASSGEFFQATANTQQPFRTKRIDFRVGAPGPYVVAEGDNNIWWLGSDGVFYCLNGYSQARISTRPIENAIKGLDWSKAFAYRWDTVIYWTFPDGLTWGYDYAEREWHRRGSYGLDRWRPSSMTFWNRRWIAGDFQAGRLWDCNLEDRYYLEGDTPFIVRRTLGVSHDNQNPVRAPRLELVMDTGQPETVAIAFPAQPAAPTITGAAPDGDTDQAYTYGYTVAGGTGALTVTLRSGALPDGLTLANDGTISGTPTTIGSFTYTLRVTDANDLWSELEDTVDVLYDIRWDSAPGEFVGAGTYAFENNDLAISAEYVGAIVGSIRAQSTRALTGKRYFEFDLEMNDNVASGAYYIGFQNQPQASWPAAPANRVSLDPQRPDGTAEIAFPIGGTFVTGLLGWSSTSFGTARIKVAVDVSTRTCWFGNASGWFSGDPATPSGGHTLQVTGEPVHLYGEISNITAAKFRRTEIVLPANWTFTPPEGFA